jgi:DNA polymerase
MKLWFDFETKSECDLKKHGAARYARHDSTDIICIAYAVDGESVQTHFTEDGDLPTELYEYFSDDSIELWAHNAAFERAIYNHVLVPKYNFPVVDLNRWRCSATLAMAHGLPGALAALTQALNLPIQKMPEGSRLIRDYCCPPFADWKPGDKNLMSDYNRIDVEAMRMACSVMRDLAPWEWNQYHVTEIMNDRGIPCDIKFAEAALEYANEIRADVADNIFTLTDGRIKKATERKARDIWLREHLPEDALSVISVKKKNKKTGAEVINISFDEKNRAKLMEHESTPEIVKEFTDLVNQAGGATIAKYAAAIDLSIDGRVNGALIFSGAGATGRYSSRGLQLQNFNRKIISEGYEELITDVIAGYQIDKPAHTLGRLARNMIAAQDGITYCDYSQIEARVCPWLTLDPAADELLELFRKNKPYYEYNAYKMYQLPSLEYMLELKQSDPKQYDELRQKAKVACLSCQFGGGASLNEVRDAWRRANPWAVRFWDALNYASESAMNKPGEVYWAGRIAFMFDGGDFLWMRLPSGRCLAYAKPEYQQITPPWATSDDAEEKIWSLTSLNGSAQRPDTRGAWPRKALSHLVFANNATQGTAADIMRESIVRAHESGIKIIGTVHDELLAEGNCIDALDSAMLNISSTYEGLPMAAESKFNLRWGK